MSELLKKYKDLFRKKVIVTCKDKTSFSGIFNNVLEEDESIIVGGTVIPICEIAKMQELL